MMSKVRLANLQDVIEINELSLHLGYEQAPLNVATQRLEYLLESPLDDVYVFESKGHVLGWIHVFCANRLASERFYEIAGLIVDPKARKQGVARQLVEAASKASKEQGVKLRVRCHSDRSEAHLFYQKIGLTLVKIQHVYGSNE
ncbi:GNAT family N-acetyltransferase [Marinomonas algicola]|uniref:GNAT family N-acetyltransferase n=1 Tax=Marinomonas algicola TaxID=2773454 RepID=UPI001749F029|nr:GNAT family N-acetyltransferase [Marinomonas algicola]